MPRTTPIETRHAVIHTSTIDVKIMRIDKREMTLSVFRQLPQVTVWQRANTPYKIVLKGKPWGVVRYTWGASPTWADMYVVWDSEGKLYRFPMLNPCDDPSGEDIISYVHYSGFWIKGEYAAKDFHEDDPYVLDEDGVRELMREVKKLRELDQLYIGT